MFWWALLAFGVVALLLLGGLFHWISTDPEIERELAGDRFRAEQDYRAARRSGELPSASSHPFKN